MELKEITDKLQEKLGKEESGKIADDIANLLSLDSARIKDIEKKDQEIEKLKSDKEMLVNANGNLLQQISMSTEDILEPKEEKKEEIKPFDMRSVFDEKGRFKTKL